MTTTTIQMPSAAVQAQPVARLHLTFLDGVRALAALFVIAHHLWRTYSKVPLAGVKGMAFNWLLYGHLAVDVFIVLSGFCLMLPVSRAGLLRGGARAFYARRARRILPPLYAAISLAVILAFLHSAHIGGSVLLANALLLQDWLPSKDTLDGPLWSVALEWKIYFLFPLFVFLWRRSGRWTALGLSAVIGWGLTILAYTMAPQLNLDHACPWYVFLFGAGMCAADAAVRESATAKQGRFCLAIAALAGVSVLRLWPINSAGDASPYDAHLPVIDCIIGALAAVCFLWLYRAGASGSRSPLLAALSWRPLVWIGTFAYSIYLIHVLLIYDLRNFLIRHLPHAPAPLVIGLTMGVVLGVAYLFHLAFERPFMGSPAPKTEGQAEVAAITSPAP